MKPLKLKLFPTRSLYVYSIVILGIVALAFVWYIMRTVFLHVQNVSSAISTMLETDVAPYSTINTLLTNIAEYILIFMLICLGIWAWQYSQKRGEPIYEP